MSNGPLPSKLTLLSALPSFEFGDKVRFLGWCVGPSLLNIHDTVLPGFFSNTPLSVTSYSTASAELTLHHNFPKTSEVKAVTDVRLLLAKLNAEQTAIGQWVNIIGYISASPLGPPTKSLKQAKAGESAAYIQALMLWTAGPLDVCRYEICLADAAKVKESEATKKNPDKAR